MSIENKQLNQIANLVDGMAANTFESSLGGCPPVHPEIAFLRDRKLPIPRGISSAAICQRFATRNPDHGDISLLEMWFRTFHQVWRCLFKQIEAGRLVRMRVGGRRVFSRPDITEELLEFWTAGVGGLTLGPCMPKKTDLRLPTAEQRFYLTQSLWDVWVRVRDGYVVDDEERAELEMGLQPPCGESMDCMIALLESDEVYSAMIACEGGFRGY